MWLYLRVTLAQLKQEDAYTSICLPYFLASYSVRSRVTRGICVVTSVTLHWTSPTQPYPIQLGPYYSGPSECGGVAPVQATRARGLHALAAGGTQQTRPGDRFAGGRAAEESRRPCTVSKGLYLSWGRPVTKGASPSGLLWL